MTVRQESVGADSDSHADDPDLADDDEFDLFYFIRNLPPLSKEQMCRPCVLPKKTRSSPPITLVLDLDETLVHCSTIPLDTFDISFPVEFNGVTYRVSGRVRPHYEDFLRRASEIFEVVVFTASQKIYADRLLNLIDPEHKYIKYRLFRDSCLFVAGNYLKDLNVLGRDLSKTLIVDNSPQAFAYQLSNGIPITSWYEDKTDTELLQVLSFLESIKAVDDVR
ncbi:HAD-like domain-containing protein [Entophlyctis helioformis]|nr:HAD-like domain-containing protein [Entophlyctis helioformis]